MDTTIMAKYIEDPALLEQLEGDTSSKKYVTDKLLIASLNGSGGEPKQAEKTTSKSGLSDIPRQIGLTARHGIEGVGGALDFLASPIRGAMNLALPNSMQIKPAAFSGLSDAIGLPSPQNATERVVGDVTRTMAGGAVPLGLASKVAQGASGITQAVARTMAANPLQQLGSAGAAGGAGGAVREEGGGDSAQFAASLLAGIAAPMTMNKAQQVGGNVASRFTPPKQINVDMKINNALSGSGLSLDDLSQSVQSSIRNDVQQALKTNGELSPDAVRRLADYRLTQTTPTAASLTLDPAMVTQQKNLAKLGINSKDAAAQQLGMVENANNRQLIDNLNTMGARQGIDSEIAGGKLQDALKAFADSKKSEISGLYSAAKDSSGRSASLDPRAFTNNAANAIDQANLNAFIPKEIRGMMNKFANGSTPLNVNTAEQFKTIIGNAQRSSMDGNARAALGMIRNALDETPLIDGLAAAKVNGGNQLKTMGGVSSEMRPNIGQDAIDAFTKARGANRAWMQQVEQTPALGAVLDDASQKGFFEKHVIAGDSKSLGNMINALGGDAGAIQGIREQTLFHLKEQALNKARDEVGNFSQSGYNSALRQIGENKLKLLFNPDEINQLKAVGRVASYEQFQPKGSAVNNSNTAAAGMSAILDRVANSPLLSKIPFGRQLAEPVQNISIGIKSGNALNVPNSLLAPRLPMQQQPSLLMSPMIFMGEKEEDKRGLLSPIR